MADQVMLTTVDNPFNPFTQFDEWYAWDEQAGYHSSALLARVVVSSDELSDYDQRLDYEAGIEEIIRENVSGMHKKVYENEEINIKSSED